METEVVRKRLNSALEFGDWTVHNEYKSISVLVLYWEDGDNPGFEREARSVGELFEIDFHYKVAYYAIPSEQSFIRLDNKINSFLEHHGGPDNLIIIHYGGHGDANDGDAQERLAIWAARAKGEPTLDWSIIQPKLGCIEAETLLLLDCCFAAQSARARQNRAVPKNVELLAACAMGVSTRPPGPHSFTTHLIKHLRALLKSTGSARISEVVNILAYRDSGFGETPVHFSGLGDGKSTVCLQPFVTNSTPHVHSDKEVAWLTLKVSLRDVLSESLITDIIRWLKARPARKVSSLTIENVVQSANQISHFIRDEDRAGTSGPKFDHLSTSAKHDILAAWSNFRSLLAALATQLRSQYTVEGINFQEQDIESYHADTVPRGPLATLLRLENGLLSLQGIVQRSVMALPDLYQNRESLLEAIDDTAMHDLGFVPLLKWRLNAQFPSGSDNLMKTEPTVEEGSVRLKAFQRLVKENLPNVGAVIIEYKSYDKATIPAGKMQSIEQNTQILVDILKLRGPPDFHSLRCIRWFHQEKENRLGLVFEYPVGCDTFKSLRDLIQADASSQRPTLAQRFLMVKSIGQALLKWHISANWVHQGIASHNIYFFKPRHSASYDYTRPYLCGFEFSRPSDGISLSTSVENFEENVYRHPSRQGAPSKYHTKQHDLYSFGILLFEVGVWTLISDYFDANMRRNLAPSKMQDRIKLNARKRLSHYMGAAYERAASRCLDMDFGVELDDPVGTKLAKAFQELILQEIEPGTRLD